MPDQEEPGGFLTRNGPSRAMMHELTCRDSPRIATPGSYPASADSRCIVRLRLTSRGGEQASVTGDSFPFRAQAPSTLRRPSQTRANFFLFDVEMERRYETEARHVQCREGCH